jgi:hypothetical protein
VQARTAIRYRVRRLPKDKFALRPHSPGSTLGRPTGAEQSLTNSLTVQDVNRGRWLLTSNLSQSPYLLVGVSSFPEQRYHVPAQVRDVASDEDRLSSFGGHAHLTNGGWQNAALGSSERLRSHPGIRCSPSPPRRWSG